MSKTKCLNLDQGRIREHALLN